MDDTVQKMIVERYRRAKERRSAWEPHWQECFEYTLPHRESAISVSMPGGKRSDKLFDGTAPHAVEQLAASLLSQMTPPWAQWFGLSMGPEVNDEERQELGGALEASATALQSQFDRSNFAVEMHQCYLDLVTAGTACLSFEEAPMGESSAFRFTAVPLGEVAFEESVDGRLDTTFRRSELSLAQFRSRFPDVKLSDQLISRAAEDPGFRIDIIEAVIPEKTKFKYTAITETELNANSGPTILQEGKFTNSPFINFRWLKTPGEVYGRSPVMKALPDIKTANKVVELILKNASIAVTGIWQAGDDGVLNPASIKLTPGTIIPKAVGSAGLTPLDSPGRFDISELVLKDQRDNIRRALMADKLGQPDAPKMTATEVLERSPEMARLLGATYGRLQSELLTPLVVRAMAILSRRGVIPDLHVDGRVVDLDYKSPLARQQAQKDAQNILRWLEAVQSVGPEGIAAVNKAEVVKYLAKAFSVPDEFIVEDRGPALSGVPSELPVDLPPGSSAGGDQLEGLMEAANEVFGGLTGTPLDNIVPASNSVQS